MKHRLSYGLLSFFILLFSVYSCRTDFLKDQHETGSEAINHTFFKTISLDKSKHKNKIFGELKEVKSQLNSVKSNNIFGKNVTFGDSIMIDTEYVYYYENEEYHTYTFNVKRIEETEDAPLENIVLSPLSNGDYQAFLISYNITAEEKESLKNGRFVNYSGRTAINEVTNMDTSSLLKGPFCIPDLYWYPVPCASGEHLPDQPGCILKGGNRAYWASGIVYDCFEPVPEPQPETLVPSPGGGGGGCDGCPISGTGDPKCLSSGKNHGDLGLIDGNGCSYVGPSLPNPGNPNPSDDNCQKTKEIVENEEVHPKIDSLKAKSKTKGEKGFNVKLDGTTSGLIDGGPHEVDLGDETGNQGGYHNHTPTGIKIFSPPDVLKLLNYAISKPGGNVGNAFFGVIGSEVCSSCTGGYKYQHYIIKYTGGLQELGTLVYSPWDKTALESWYLKQEFLLASNPAYSDDGGATLNTKGLEKLFFNMLNKMGLQNKVSLQRIDDSNVVKNVKIDLTTGEPEEIPCP